MMTADDNAVVDSPAEGQLLRLLRHVSDGFVALDRDWRFTFVNPAAEELLRRPNAGLVGQSLWEAIPEAHASRFFEPLSRAMNDRVATQAEEFYQPRDARYVRKSWTKVVEGQPSGNALM